MNQRMILVSILFFLFIGGQAIAADQISDQELRTRDSETEEIHQKRRHIQQHVRQKIKREHRRVRRHHRLNHLRHRHTQHNIRISVE